MGRNEILFNLISTYGVLSKEQNKKIINDYEELNPDSVGLYKFINYYNQFTQKPIKQDQINMFFKYIKI
jgi:hypothetical protein